LCAAAALPNVVVLVVVVVVVDVSDEILFHCFNSQQKSRLEKKKNIRRKMLNPNSESLVRHKKLLALTNAATKEKRATLPVVYTTYPDEKMYSKLVISSLLANSNNPANTRVKSAHPNLSRSLGSTSWTAGAGSPGSQTDESAAVFNSQSADIGVASRVNVYYSRNEINFRLAKALRNRRNVSRRQQ
jgi:hypothetical protein